MEKTDPTDSTDPIYDEEDFSDLTQRQIRFIEEYLILGNKQRAAINAGYSVRSAGVTACKELRNAKVRNYYLYRTKQIADKSQDKVNKLIARLEEIAFADIKDFVLKDGTIRPMDKKINGRCIQSIKHTMHGINIQLCSQEKAIELLGRFYGVFKDNLDVTTNGKELSPINISFEEVTKESKEPKEPKESSEDEALPKILNEDDKDQNALLDFLESNAQDEGSNEEPTDDMLDMLE